MIPPALFYGLVLLNLLFVTGAWCLARPSRAAAVVLIFVSVLWVLFNGPIEGHVLLSYTYQNGLTSRICCRWQVSSSRSERCGYAGVGDK